MSELITPNDLKKIAEEKEAEKLREALERKRKMDEEEQGVREQFMAQDVRPDVQERLSAALKRAAESGLSELKIMEFPASFCTDGGRAINNYEESWPETLQGWAKRAYDYFVKELEPKGFKLRAQILSYPEGNLGTVGIFLRW